MYNFFSPAYPIHNHTESIQIVKIDLHNIFYYMLMKFFPIFIVYSWTRLLGDTVQYVELVSRCVILNVNCSVKLKQANDI